MQTTLLEYDERNRLVEKTEQDPDPGNMSSADIPVWGYQYDLQGNLRFQTDPAGNETEFLYDRLSRQTTTKLPDPDGGGPVFRAWYVTAYDAVGRVTRQTDPLGNYQVFFYDALSDNWTKFDKGSDDSFITITYMGFNANQQLIYTNVGMRRTDVEYDALGRTTKVIQPDPDDDMEFGETYTNSNPLARPYVTYAYDANGNRTSETNELGETTAYGFDYLNRLTSRTDPTIAAGTPVTEYTYDVFGNRLTLDDPEDNTTTWTYDLLNRVKSETNELNDARTFTYNVRGDLTVKVDRLGRRTEYTYDLLGRRTLEEWVTSLTPVRTVSQYISYGYDTRGNLTASESAFPGSPYAQFAYTYNAAGWLTEETLAQAALLKTKFTIGYDSTSHNSLGQRTLVQASFSTNGPTFSTWTNDYQNEYTYDGKNRLATLKQSSQPGGGTNSVVASKYIVLGYNEHDQVIDIDRYANTTTSNLVAHSDYTYDNAGRVTDIDHLKGGTTFSAYDLTWDARSRITALDEVFSNSGWNENHDYTYDDTDQLTGADHSVQGDESYVYDTNGNRDGSQTRLGATATWTVDINNRVTFDGEYNYTYDAEGNLTWKYKTGDYVQYVYDHRNRLARVAFRTASTGNTYQDVYYRYDYQNRMIRRLFDADGDATVNTTNRMYIHDGMQIVQIFDRPSSTVNLTDRLLWTDQVDFLISDERVSSLGSAGTVYWSLPNHLGTVVDLATYNSGTDTTTIAKHRGFDSFGNITSDSASGVIIVMGYTGKLLDSTTGLQNNINRWYTAPLGEWMSEDPIGFEGKDENLRRYVSNRSTYATDPTGLTILSAFESALRSVAQQAIAAVAQTVPILTSMIANGNMVWLEGRLKVYEVTPVGAPPPRWADFLKELFYKRQRQFAEELEDGIHRTFDPISGVLFRAGSVTPPAIYREVKIFSHSFDGVVNRPGLAGRRAIHGVKVRYYYELKLAMFIRCS